MQLIRVVFPQWNFFDRLTGRFELQLQFGEPDVTTWRTLSFEQARHTYDLIYSPKTNLALAQMSLLEHFAMDLMDLPESAEPHAIESLTSFALLQSLAQVQTGPKDPTKNQKMRWRVVETQLGSQPASVLYTSDCMEAPHA